MIVKNEMYLDVPRRTFFERDNI